MTGVVYKARNIKNGQVYIGSTTIPIKRRISNHYNASKFYKGRDRRPFLVALQATTREDWEWTILETVEFSSRNELNSRERYYIQFYQSWVPETGYNLVGSGQTLVSEMLKDKRLKRLALAKARHEHYQRIIDEKLPLTAFITKKVKPYQEKKINLNLGQHRNRPVRCVETGHVFLSASSASRALEGSNRAVHVAIRTGTTFRGLHWEYTDSCSDSGDTN